MIVCCFMRHCGWLDFFTILYRYIQKEVALNGFFYEQQNIKEQIKNKQNKLFASQPVQKYLIAADWRQENKKVAYFTKK